MNSRNDDIYTGESIVSKDFKAGALNHAIGVYSEDSWAVLDFVPFQVLAKL
jgi:hypothetical protein